MRWIKASERLPPYKYEHDVFYKWDGEREDGFIRYEKGKPLFSYMRGTYIDTEDLSKLEWLDEYTSLVSASEDEEIAKWYNEAKEAWRKIEIYKDSGDRYKTAYEEQCEEIARLKEDVKAEREPAGKLMEALVAILKEPYGCRFCDSGKLRKPNNPAKDHDYDCGYLLAITAINEYNNTRS